MIQRSKHITVQSKEKPAGVNRLARSPALAFQAALASALLGLVADPRFSGDGSAGTLPIRETFPKRCWARSTGVRAARQRAVANVASEFSVEKVPPLFCATDRTRPNLGRSLGLIVSIKAFRRRASSESCIRLYYLM